MTTHPPDLMQLPRYVGAVLYLAALQSQLSSIPLKAVTRVRIPQGAQ